MSGPCDRPLPLQALLDYWLEEPERQDDDEVEEHLLACDGCSERLGELLALGEGVRRLAGEGAVEVVVTRRFLEMAAREARHTREYRVPPGGRVDCTVTPEDDLLVARLEGDFKGITRLDIVSQLDAGPEQRLEDVPFTPDAGELIVAQSMPAVRAMGRSRLRLRLLAQGPAGERTIGEYTFDHAPAG